TTSTKFDMSTTAPSPDRRVGLRAGWMNAADAAWNLRLVSAAPKPQSFTNLNDLGDFGYLNSDLAFTGHYVIQGNFHGLQVWDIAQPSHPVLVTTYVCPEQQNDVSVYRNLLFASGEDFNGRLDCGIGGVPDSVSKPAILADLAHREAHGEAPEDIAEAAKAAAEARAKGGFTATVRGEEIVLGPRFVAAQLDSIVKARGGSGAPTGADSATLRAA